MGLRFFFVDFLRHQPSSRFYRSGHVYTFHLIPLYFRTSNTLGLPWTLVQGAVDRFGPAIWMMLSFSSVRSWIRLGDFEFQGGESHTITAFVGQIMDSKGVTMGFHDTTLKKSGAKDTRDCMLSWAKAGSFVQYDSATKNVYQLNDREKPVHFVGQKVKIYGAYDKWSQTKEIESIEPAGSELLKLSSIHFSHGFIRY